ncbi:hypothetical protein FACS1894217_05520 [Clostridia bacterium]|nr:hypothetical protein FACS1894217_05520 [Clostridia bacterium]
MARKNESFHCKVFRIDTEYYTFISGALISMPLTLLFEATDNYREPAFWIALCLSVFSSFLCFKLSIVLKEVNEIYNSNKAGTGDTATAWNSAINEKRTSCIVYLSLTILTIIIAITCVFLMQFIDSTVGKVIEDTASQAVSSIQ